jgi:DNA-binding LacI/PurR family transcriptional regulator
VPGRISVVGVDDSDVRTHVWPRLSAVTQNATALGLEAALWLTQTITSGKERLACRRTIATSFEINGTTGPAPAEAEKRNRARNSSRSGR